MSIPRRCARRRLRVVTCLLAAGLLLPVSDAIAHGDTLPRLPGIQAMSLHPAPASVYTAPQDRQGMHRITAEFKDHAGAPLRIRFDLERGASLASMKAFGYSDADILELHRQCTPSRGCPQAELERRLAQYYREHALQSRQIPGRGTRLSVDIPSVVRRSRPHVQPLAAALRQVGRERGYDADAMLATAAALVQSGLDYRTPAAVEDGRRTLGFYTPPRTLEKGYGDCDTKSALLAAVLANLGESGIIGVRVPNHYLLGVARQPREGDVHLEFRGQPYVLIEAAGPAARRPGDVARLTRTALSRGAPIRIDPIL